MGGREKREKGKRKGGLRATPSIILTGSEKEFFELCNKILNGMISTVKKKGDSYGDK